MHAFIHRSWELPSSALLARIPSARLIQDAGLTEKYSIEFLLSATNRHRVKSVPSKSRHRAQTRPFVSSMAARSSGRVDGVAQEGKKVSVRTRWTGALLPLHACDSRPTGEEKKGALPGACGPPRESVGASRAELERSWELCLSKQFDCAGEHRVATKACVSQRESG
jgi:hypothetical protein